MDSASVYLLAKEPGPGRVKTRLCPPLTPEQASDCHQAFVTDSLAMLNRAAAQAQNRCPLRSIRVTLAAAVLPDGAACAAADRGKALGESWLAGQAAAFRLELVEQVAGDLGARMADLARRGLEASPAVVLLGSDSPHLPIKRVTEALEALQHADCVLGPSSDGGYYLVALRRRIPELFAPGMAWGGPSVLAESLRRLDQVGASVALLAEDFDLDTMADLERLATQLAQDSGVSGGEAQPALALTRAVLSRLLGSMPSPSREQPPASDRALVCLTTAPDGEAASRIARSLVDAGLAACVSQLPIASTYRWQGRTVEEGEVLLLIKSREGLWEQLMAAVRSLHPYEVPELVALPTHAVEETYLGWLLAATGAGASPGS